MYAANYLNRTDIVTRERLWSVSRETSEPDVRCA